MKSPCPKEIWWRQRGSQPPIGVVVRCPNPHRRPETEQQSKEKQSKAKQRKAKQSKEKQRKERKRKERKRKSKEKQRKEKRTNERTHKQTNERTNGRTNGVYDKSDQSFPGCASTHYRGTPGIYKGSSSALIKGSYRLTKFR